MKNLTKKQIKLIHQSLVDYLLAKAFREEMIYGTPYMRVSYKEIYDKLREKYLL